MYLPEGYKYNISKEAPVYLVFNVTEGMVWKNVYVSSDAAKNAVVADRKANHHYKIMKAFFIAQGHPTEFAWESVE